MGCSHAQRELTGSQSECNERRVHIVGRMLNPPASGCSALPGLSRILFVIFKDGGLFPPDWEGVAAPN